MLDENEWSNIEETLRLLSDKQSLAALLQSHAIRERSQKPKGITPEEAFKDVYTSKGHKLRFFAGHEHQ